MEQAKHRQELVRILQWAHAGELGAASAYRGHWKTVTAPDEVEGIRRIEQDEWKHRAQVRRMLAELGAAPRPPYELLIGTIGKTLGTLCPVSGWFFPMYFAGRLEFGNVDQYEVAAHHAARLGLKDMAQELHVMTRTEREHEIFFMKKVEGHPLLPLVQFILRWGPDARKNTQEVAP
ncbi:MAG TPA: ferritin-like domain-containing protein [bacterium]|nr:ferritin-like domain-containing protein [bacterium]